MIADLHAAPMPPGISRQRANVGGFRRMAAKIKPAFARDFSCAFIFRLGVDHEESAHMREAELIGFDYQGTGPTVFDPAVFAIGLGKKGVGLSLNSSAETNSLARSRTPGWLPFNCRTNSAP